MNDMGNHGKIAGKKGVFVRLVSSDFTESPLELRKVSDSDHKNHDMRSEGVVVVVCMVWCGVVVLWVIRTRTFPRFQQCFVLYTQLEVCHVRTQLSCLSGQPEKDRKKTQQGPKRPIDWWRKSERPSFLGARLGR